MSSPGTPKKLKARSTKVPRDKEASNNDEEDEVPYEKEDENGLMEEEKVPSGDAGWKGFCTAFRNIMGRTVEEGKVPILCDTKVTETLKARKAEFKEKRMLSMQKKAEKDKGHTLPDITKKGFEMQLRKIATTGVVRLFNTIKEFRMRIGDEEEDQQRNLKKVPIRQRSKRAADTAKETFDKAWKEGPSSKKRKTTNEKKGQISLGIDIDPMAEFA